MYAMDTSSSNTNAVVTDVIDAPKEEEAGPKVEAAYDASDEIDADASSAPTPPLPVEENSQHGSVDEQVPGEDVLKEPERDSGVDEQPREVEDASRMSVGAEGRASLGSEPPKEVGSAGAAAPFGTSGVHGTDESRTEPATAQGEESEHPALDSSSDAAAVTPHQVAEGVAKEGASEGAGESSSAAEPLAPARGRSRSVAYDTTRGSSLLFEDSPRSRSSSGSRRPLKRPVRRGSSPKP